MYKVVVGLLFAASLAGIARGEEISPPEQRQRAFGPRPPRPRDRPSTTPLEVAQLGHQLEGTYRCSNGATLDIQLVLETAWLEFAFASKTGSSRELRTYDQVSKQWTRIQLTSAATQAIATSVGDDAGTWTWVSARGRTTEKHGKSSIELADGDRKLTCSR